MWVIDNYEFKYCNVNIFLNQNSSSKRVQPSGDSTESQLLGRNSFSVRVDALTSPSYKTILIKKN